MSTVSRNNNGLQQFCKQHELSRLGEDLCYIQRRDYDSRRPFKWNTYNYHPYDGSKVVAPCYVGQQYRDGYGVGAANVDADSRAKLHPGNVLTNPNVHQELPALHVQMPRVRGYFDSDTESNLRPEMDYNFGGCTLTTEKSYIPHTFQYFNQLCYDPQDPMYIIEEDTFNQTYPNAQFYHRAGEETRHDRQEKYRNGCDWKSKVSPPRLSYSNFGN
jgi:hypothetical protein